MSERVKAVIRLLVALVPVVNIILVQYGKSPLPFTEDQINAGLSAVVAVCGIIHERKNFRRAVLRPCHIVPRVQSHPRPIVGSIVRSFKRPGLRSASLIART